MPTSTIEGVIPPALVPFRDDQTIHEDGYRSHIAELDEYGGVGGILCNGHAGESYALTTAERARIVELADSTATETPVYSGVVGATTDEVVDDAVAMADAGADAIMVDAPTTPIHGRPAAAKQFFRSVADAVDLPIVLFQISVHSGQNFTPELLAELATIDGIVAIKEGVWDVDHTQQDVRAIRERNLDVSFLMGNDEHLLPCYALGVDGTVVELAAAFPEEIIMLYEAVQEGRMAVAQETYYALAPVLDAVYQKPTHDSSIRLKVVMELQDRLPTSVPREPALPIPAEEVMEIEGALTDAGLL
jgi:4-hydroxy-tetrahydrodipicolinate synthase